MLASFLPASPVPLDPRQRAEAQAAVEAAEAMVGQAEALHEQAAQERAFAESTLNRLRRLQEEGVTSEEQLEIAQLELDTRQEALEAAEFAVRDARGKLAVARARVQRFRFRPGDAGTGNPEAIQIFSPVDGVVLRRLRESEAVVPAGEPLLEVGDPRELEVVTDYLSNDAVRMRAGQSALIDRWGGDRPLRGRVLRVEPSGFTKISALGVEEQRVNVIMEPRGALRGAVQPGRRLPGRNPGRGLGSRRIR